MSELTPAEQRRFAVEGIAPLCALREKIAFGATWKIIAYPPGADIPDRIHPDDEARFRAAAAAAVDEEAKR